MDEISILLIANSVGLIVATIILSYYFFKDIKK